MFLQVSDREKLSGIAFSEPLSASTETRRRALLFTSSFSILLTVYGLRVSKTPWLDIDVPAGAPNILHGAMSVALLYTFAVFVLYVWTDMRRWLAANDLLRLHGYGDLMLKTHNYMNGVSQWIQKPLPDEEKKMVSVQQMFADAATFLRALEGEIARARKSHRVLSTMQLARLLVLDLGVPLVLGVFAMFKIGPALTPFLSVVIK